MKNLFYAAVVVGIIALLAGIVFLVTGHHKLDLAGIIVGIILIIVGIAGALMGRPKTA